ncbi:hypothetical protein V2G26_021108 [Clonostachys chloroleuca]
MLQHTPPAPLPLHTAATPILFFSSHDNHHLKSTNKVHPMSLALWVWIFKCRFKCLGTRWRSNTLHSPSPPARGILRCFQAIRPFVLHEMQRSHRH